MIWLCIMLLILSQLLPAESGKVVYCRTGTNYEEKNLRFQQQYEQIRANVAKQRVYRTSDAPEPCVPSFISDANDREVHSAEFQRLLSVQLWNRPRYDLVPDMMPELKTLEPDAGKSYRWNCFYYHSMYHSLRHYGPGRGGLRRKPQKQKQKQVDMEVDTGTGAAGGAESKMAWLDFGVYQGFSVNMTSVMLRDEPRVEVHGFDSWLGLPEDWAQHVRMKKGYFSTQGVLPPVRAGVTLHKGFFNETLPQWLEAHPDMPIYGISVDCDLYNGSMDVLTRLGRRLQVGSIIHFHELRHKLEDGQVMDEARALYDWLQTMPSSFRVRLVPMQDSRVAEPAVFIVRHL